MMSKKIVVHHEPSEPRVFQVKVATKQLVELLNAPDLKADNLDVLESKNFVEKIKKLFTRFHLKKTTSIAVLGAFLIIFSLLGVFYGHTQRPVSMVLAQRSEGHPIDESVKITFSQALSKETQLEISPEAKGRWEYSHNIFGIHGAEFKPEGSGLSPATQYTIHTKQIKRVLVGKAVPSQRAQLETEFAPGVVSVSPKPKSKDILITKPITIVFSEPRTSQNEPVLQITPAVELNQEVSSDKRRYSWTPKSNLAQSGQYIVVVTEKNVTATKLVEIPFETVRQPSIVQATNKEYFYPEEKISVDFDIAMDTSNPAIKCQCQGEGKWESATHYTFQPSSIEPGKKYSYIVPKDLKSAIGGIREADAGYVISTPGTVKTSVVGSSQAQLNTKVTLNFDQAVKRETVQSKVSLEPAVPFSLTWIDDKTATVILNKLDHQTTYTVNVAAGVAPQKFGLTSTQPFSGRTTTVAQTIKLPVPVYRQAYSLSCEEASLRMALAYRGIQASDMEILQRVGYNPRPYDAATNSWDDPNVAFVGSVTGSQARKTGYGVYAGPIAKAARSYGRDATAATGVSASYLAQAIHDGNPVVIWGTSSGSGTRIDWNTPNGVVGAWNGQHARTLVGVVGKPSAPIGFYINDPLGGHSYWTAASLMAHMNRHGNLTNQAVVVY